MLVLLLLGAVLVPGCAAPGPSPDTGEGTPDAGDDAERVNVYPTYAYREDGEWRIPLSYRVHEDRSWLTRVVSNVAASFGDLEPVELERLRERIHDFSSDSESLETVTFVVEEDPAGTRYRLEDADGEPVRTGLNGRAEGILTLPASRMEAIRDAGGVEDEWISLRAVSPDHTGTGRVQLVEDRGLSVISDIDDTVKRTGIAEGARTVVRKTFLEEWEAVPGMAERFQRWEAQADGALAVHYVSAGPWQLQRHLAGFLFSPEVGLPEGSFRMRPVRKHPLSLRTWRDLYGLVVDEDDTFDFKVEETARIVERFPEREFILVGDTSQEDPEAYRAVRERFPERIRAIVIRDVTEARTRAPERLEGMTVVPADDPGSGAR